jgi:hypothetical protein
MKAASRLFLIALAVATAVSAAAAERHSCPASGKAVQGWRKPDCCGAYMSRYPCLLTARPAECRLSPLR